MKPRSPILLLFSAVVVSAALLLVQIAISLSANDGWESVAPGIAYQQFQLPDPNNVYVARMDRSDPDVIIESSIAQGRLSGGTETVSSMFERYEQTINYWGQSWGGRNDVVVAINGYFYGGDFEPPGVPWRGQIHSGWYAKRFDDNQNGSGFVWKLDRTAFIGECVQHQADEQLLSFTGITETLKIHGLNVPRGDDQLILYTPQYDASTLTDASGVEVLVEMTRPALVLPIPSTPPDPLASFGAIGYVRDIRDGQGNTPIPFDHVVLSASGIMRTKLLDYAQIGGEIGISQAINHLSDDDCATPVAGDWTKAYASVGGSFYFLKDGVIQDFSGDPQATTRAPRTAIAFNDQYIFFIVVDGRDPGISEGMTIPELAGFALNTLGADYGIAQDGGGSSTMVINGQVVNKPSDRLAAYCVYLPLVVNQGAGPGAAAVPQTDQESPCQIPVERPVANGMMMVRVEPITQSLALTPTQIVTTSLTATLRLGPGNNYAALATLPPGSVGQIQPHTNGLNGVLATGSYWWRADFGGLTGWIAEQELGTGK